ncbi:MAG: DUF1804 family protein [Sphaerochaetaceae bacterium]
MAKSDETRKQAKNMYVVYHMAIKDISLELDVAVRTLQNWKGEDKWDDERSRLDGDAGAYYTELYSLGCAMAKQIRKDEEAGKQVSTSRYAALNRVLQAAEQAKEIEKGLAKPSGKNAEDRKAAAIAQIKQSLGVR